MRHGVDSAVEKSLPALVAAMNAMNTIAGDGLIDLGELTRLLTERDREVANPFTKDAQLTAVRGREGMWVTGCFVPPSRTGSLTWRRGR
jgi:hypothetical protein